MTDVRNAAAAAQDAVGPGRRARVLEPSPPAVLDGEWFADDPVNAAPDGDGPIVSPVGNGDLRWDDVADGDGELEQFASSRWLGAYRQLPPLPSTFGDTRRALHRLATYVIAPDRHRATGKFGLRYTVGGFGTPFYGSDRQIRVEGGVLVVQEAGEVRSAPVTTLRAAAELIGGEIDVETAAEHDSPPVGDVDADLGVDVAAATYLGEWFGLGMSVLEELRADVASVDPGRVQIWPGHFDPALEIGDEDHRASYGASPGDDAMPEPYLYVSIWWPDRLDLDTDDPVWSAPAFTGAVLPVSGLGSGPDQRVRALDFFRRARDHLTSA